MALSNHQENGIAISMLFFKRLENEPCLYIRHDEDNTIVLLALYVDDLVIAGSSQEAITMVKRQLNGNYKMKDLGVINHILGCETKHDKLTGTTYITQCQFTKSAIEKFLPPNTNPSENPCNPNIVLSKSMSPVSPKEKGETSNIPYREAVGTLLWLSLGTSPEMYYAKFNDYFGKEHWDAVKKIFRYLKGTIRFGLKFCANKSSTEIMKKFNSLSYLSDKDEISLNYNIDALIELLRILL